MNGFEINVNNCNEQSWGFNEDENEIEYKSYNSSLKMYVIYNYMLNVAKNKEQNNDPINILFNKWFINKCKNNDWKYSVKFLMRFYQVLIVIISS